jgi:ribonuclease-3
VRIEENDGLAESLDALQTALGYRFSRPELLLHAVTHSSYAHEKNLTAVDDNERLEFLGDAVLGFLISELLYRVHPDLKEGDLTKLKAFLVSAANLHAYAERFSIGQSLLLSRGEEKTGGRTKQALMVDAFEAVLAAVFLDGGIGAARAVVHEAFQTQVSEVDGPDPISNFKSSLQEDLQARGERPARYRLVEERGPDHERTFKVEVVLDGEPIAIGRGSTKKAAEQEAAMEAIKILRGREPSGEGT